MTNQGDTGGRYYLSDTFVEVVAQGLFCFVFSFIYIFSPTFSVWTFICQMMLVITCCFVMFLARSSHTSFISIFPPVCRNIAKQSFLETLQDNLIEMDILASAGRDASYNDGYVACSLSSNLLCHENSSQSCTILPSNMFSFLNAVGHECVSSLLPLFLIICVSFLFDTTNNVHPVILFSCIAVD